MITKQQVVNVLVELPQAIREAEAGVASASLHRTEIGQNLDLRRAQLALSIEREVDEQGRKRYTNAETRAHVLEVMCAEDEEYEKLRSEYATVMEHLAQAEVELAYQRTRLKVAELLVQLLSSQESTDEDRQVQKDRGELRGGDRSKDRQPRRVEDW